MIISLHRRDNVLPAGSGPAEGQPFAKDANQLGEFNKLSLDGAPCWPWEHSAVWGSLSAPVWMQVNAADASWFVLGARDTDKHVVLCL